MCACVCTRGSLETSSESGPACVPQVHVRVCMHACMRASVHVVTIEVPRCCWGGLRAADCECVTHPGRILSRPAVQIRLGDKRQRREGRREGEMSAEERER